MQIRSQNYKIKGMRQDESYSAFNPEYSWSNKNIRLTARGGNDMLSVTNEKGNTEVVCFSDVIYSYQLLFNGYLDGLAPPTYDYSLLFNGYLDVLVPPTYEYSLSFSGHEDTLVPPTYDYQLKFSSYSNTLIESI